MNTRVSRALLVTLVCSVLLSLRTNYNRRGLYFVTTRKLLRTAVAPTYFERGSAQNESRTEDASNWSDEAQSSLQKEELPQASTPRLINKEQEVLRKKEDETINIGSLLSKADQQPDHAKTEDVKVGAHSSHVSNDKHFSKTAFLPLQQWEMASVEGLENFPRDQGIPEFCALGTISNSGVLEQDSTCATNSDYDFVERSFRAQFAEDGVCDVCRILELGKAMNRTLATKNQNKPLTLALLGDSMSLQSFGGLVCEFARRGYEVNVTEHRNMRTDDCPGPWMCLRERITVQVMGARNNNNNSQGDDDDDDDNNKNSNSLLTLYYFGQYQFHPRLQRFYQTTLQHVLDVEPDILILNFGLHYSWLDSDRFKKAMWVLLEGIQKHLVGRIPLIMYRENSAQHFKTSYGEFGLPRVGLHGDRPGRCGSLASRGGNVTYQWRDQRLRQWALDQGIDVVQLDLATTPQPSDGMERGGVVVHRSKNNTTKQQIVWLPFTNTTAPHHTLHPDECTHFCHTPFLWYPLWRGIRIASEWKFGGTADDTTTAETS